MIFQEPINLTHNICRDFNFQGSFGRDLRRGGPVAQAGAPIYVVNVVMPIVWEYLTQDWKVGLHFWCLNSIVMIVFFLM